MPSEGNIATTPSPDLILRHIADALVLLDAEGRVTFANEAFCQMIGRGLEQVRGRRWVDLADTDVCARLDLLVTPPVDGQTHFNIDLAAPSGVRRTYCLTTTRVHDANGHPAGVLQNFRSMDRLRDMILELEEVNDAVQREKDRAEHVMDSVADGIFTVDRDLVVRSFSRKMERLTGIAAAEAVGRACADVLCGTKCETDCPLRWSLAHGAIVERCRERVHGRDGLAIPVTVTTAFLHDRHGETTGLTGVVRDETEIEQLRRDLHDPFRRHHLVGRSAPLRELVTAVEMLASADATCLITGETGTGKELVAQAIHHGSTRRDRPFVSVNCAALNDNLLESELFGHVRGAFTGAIHDRPGRFEAAGGGTIFLDEIGDTTPAFQAKLLRVLQEKTFERVGDTRSRRADVRVIAATNRDLQRLVQEGAFRPDLYYRLAVVPIRVPALRERREDIPLLVEHFIEHYRPRYFAGREDRFEGISTRALALLVAYDWPGNVRELEHAIEYAMISTTTSRIERAFLPAAIRDLPQNAAACGRAEALPLHESGATGRAAIVPLGETATPAPVAGGLQPSRPASRSSNDTEADRLRRLLEQHRWNESSVARALGVSRTTVWRRMRRLGLLASR